MLEIYVDLVNMFDYYFNIFERDEEGSLKMVGKSTQAELIEKIIGFAKKANTKSIHLLAMNQNFSQPFKEALDKKGYNTKLEFIA